MKLAFFALSIAISTQTFAQELEMTYNVDAQKAEFVKVFQCPDKPAAELFGYAKAWVNTIYKGQVDVFDAEKENEMLRCNGYEVDAFTLTDDPTSKVKFLYRFQLDFKEGKVKYKVYNMKASGDEGAMAVGKYCFTTDGTPKTTVKGKNVRTAITKRINELAMGLEKALAGGGVEEEDDW